MTEQNPQDSTPAPVNEDSMLAAEKPAVKPKTTEQLVA